MGFAPDQVDRMSLWKYGACVDGYNRAHSSEEDAAKLSDAEIVEIGSWLDQRERA